MDDISPENLKKKVLELEAALKESEEKFRLIVENTAETISILDMNLHFVYVNPTIRNLRGFTVEEAKGQSLEQVLTPESLKYAFSVFEQEMELEASGTADPDRTRILELEEYRKDGAAIWVEVSFSFLRDKDRKPVGILNVSRDITKRKQAEAALLKSEIKYRALFENSADAIMIVEPPSWRFTSGNPSMARMFMAKNEAEFLSLGPWDVSPERQPDGRLSSEKALAMLKTAMWDGSFSFEWTHRRLNGEEFPATVLLTRMTIGENVFIQGTVRDITHLKLTEAYRETGREILQILNEPGNMHNCIRRVLAELKTRIGLDAVGIRLQDGDDFPYFVQEGFPNDFLQTEDTLIERSNANGEACRNKDGSVRLECTCGLVISGQTDPANPLFTRGGSFWTNDAFQLLDLPADADPRLNPRNQCMHHGYGSMALVPVRSKDRIVGLIQLNDRRKGRFSLESVELIEGIASHIGGALMRKQAEEALRESEEKYRNLFSNAEVGIFRSRLDGSEVMEVNRKFLDIVGMTMEEVKGKPSVNLWADPKEREEMAKKLVADGSVSAFEYRMLNKRQGDVRNCLTSLRLYREQGILEGSILDITERKRAEVALQMFKETVENSSNVIGMSTPEGKHFYQNAAFDNMFGSIGDNPSSVYVDKTVADEMFKTIKAGERWNGEVKMFAKDGNVRDIMLRAYANKDGNGRVTGLVGIHTDITERKRAEEALRESVARFKALFNATSDSVILIDPEGMILDLNEHAAHRRDLEAEAMLGRNLFDFLPPEAADIRRKAVAHVLREAKLVQYEESRYFKNYSIRLFPVMNDTGKVIQVASFSRDITEIKRAEEARFETLARFSGFSEASQYGMGMADLDGRIIYANPTLVRMLGEASPEACLGKHFPTAYYSQAMAGKLQEEVLPVLMRGGQWQGELELIALDGRHIPTEENYFVISDEHGRPRYLADILTDITGRKRAEEEKARLEGQFHQAQKMESVGRLAGGVAHDFNNMLSVILGFTEMAMAKVDPSLPLFADLGEIRKAASRSADLTRQLLAFARKQTIAPKVLDLNETVGGMINMLRRLIGEDIDLIWKPGAALWPAKMDPSQIDQVLANLCVNARDAITDVGKITIETKNTVLDKAFCAVKPGCLPGEYLQLSVSDNGKGMGKETLGQIFEPFFTTKAVGKGTGLGLATVYGIVKQNNGFIDVVSEPGQGTAFAIYLPRHAAKAGQMQKEAPAKPAERGHETILLVEDEPAILGMATQMLEMQGYIVLAAGTPGEAVRLAREHAGEIHLLMTDIVMPEMNGRDLAKNILSLYPNIKRLFMSGYTTDIIAHHGVLEDGVQFIQKPFMISDLAATIRKALGEE